MQEGGAWGGGRLERRDVFALPSSAPNCGGCVVVGGRGVFVVEEEGELGAWV